MLCEYDGQVLPETPEGIPDACPTCEADIQAHLKECRACRLAPNLPDTIDITEVIQAWS